MEEPVSFDAADLRAEKEKVLSAVRLPADLGLHTARGQYSGGWSGGEKVVGFDLEWEKFKSKAGEDSAKRCVSLVQIAAEEKVALFHLAVFRGGDSTEELMPPSLRAFLENPKIIKVGVNIGGDATRLRNCFGVEMQGNIELSHLYKLVTYGESNPAKVNRGLYALASQVKEVLHLPLAKGAVRTSSWSKRLNTPLTIESRK